MQRATTHGQRRCIGADQLAVRVLDRLGRQLRIEAAQCLAQPAIEQRLCQVKAGDTFQCLNPSGNFDPHQFADPRKFDPTRKGNRHYTLIAGVHSCLGGHLARRELRALLVQDCERDRLPFT